MIHALLVALGLVFVIEGLLGSGPFEIYDAGHGKCAGGNFAHGRFGCSRVWRFRGLAHARNFWRVIFRR
jgi:hypothetical protein